MYVMTTFAPLSFLYIQVRCGVSSFLFVSNSHYAPGKYITYFLSRSQQQSVSQVTSLSLLRRDDDSTLTLITQFPPLIEQFYYKIDRSAPNTPHSVYLYTHQPALLQPASVRECAMRIAS